VFSSGTLCYLGGTSPVSWRLVPVCVSVCCIWFLRNTNAGYKKNVKDAILDKNIRAKRVCPGFQRRHSRQRTSSRRTPPRHLVVAIVSPSLTPAPPARPILSLSLCAGRPGWPWSSPFPGNGALPFFDLPVMCSLWSLASTCCYAMKFLLLGLEMSRRFFFVPGSRGFDLVK
jgi:hypothetical protein